MNQQSLRATLQEFHAELEKTKAVDPATQANLEHLKRDIQQVLDHPDAEITPHHHSLRVRLGDSLAQFEVSHPMLSSYAQRALDALNEMGI